MPAPRLPVVLLVVAAGCGERGDCAGGLGATIDLAEADIVIRGNEDSMLGGHVALGDADGDGRADIVAADGDGWVYVLPAVCGAIDVAGAPRIGDEPQLLLEVYQIAVGPDHTVAVTHQFEDGRSVVDLFVGPFSGDVPYGAGVARISPPDGFWFGPSGRGTSLPGDVTGDGVGDLALGGDVVSLLAGPFSGKVDGEAAATLTIVGAESPDVEGTVTPADLVGGDVTGDGVVDLLAPSQGRHSVAVFDGPVGAGEVSFTDGLAVLGPHEDASTDNGYLYPPSTGDLDGDGVAEVVMPTVWTDHRLGYDGERWIGAAVWTTTSPGDAVATLEDAPKDRGGGAYHGLGRVIAAGDVDGDGAGDVVAPYIVSNDQDPTSALVYYGPLFGALDALADADVVVAQRNTGIAGLEGGVAAGDLDGDGRSDLVFGDTYEHDTDGAVWVLFGG